ncbi:MAG: hypothetical protein A2X46_09685 [Lentisphaerae bacterium GWF2_57_35]|nr:MAG: hypothetical protein A2X46_09685 [Lentisphaerae bacterium GWF2_57_35]
MSANGREKNMKRYSPKKWILSLAVLAGLMGMWAGCESDKDTDVDNLDDYFATHPYVTDPRTQPNGIVTLKPANASVTFVGQTVIFTAVGGKAPYSWDAVNGSGSVAMRADNQGIYTATALEPNTVICFDTAGHTAVAQISTASTNSPSTPLIVTPSSATLIINGDTIPLVVTGGTAPYSWTVYDPGLGLVNPSSGSSVTYRRLNSPNNIVTVTDSVGNSQNVPITQP